MRAVRNEKGVLKLVHPGRHVEIHREPIMAAEIMRRNPRHCITRPDVFQFPWIVVKPESILLPGTVFFIVPNHTIYNLIKSKPQYSQNHHSLAMHSADIITKNRQTQKQVFTTKCLPWKMYPCMTVQKRSRVEIWPKGIEYRDTQKEEESTAETRAYHAIEYRKSSEEYSGRESLEEDVDLERLYEQVTMLKSCCRKPDSIRRLLNLKVSFDLPVKEGEQSFLGVEIIDSDTSK